MSLFTSPGIFPPDFKVREWLFPDQVLRMPCQNK
jgi:hypothetical protein